MAIRVTLKFQGTESVREFTGDSVVIGRIGASAGGLDLSNDPMVSRQHALLQVKNGVCWLTDTGSKFGTRVNGREIRSAGECQIGPEDAINVGDTVLQIACTPATGKGGGLADGELPDWARPLQALAELPPASESTSVPDVCILKAMDTRRGAAGEAGTEGPVTDQRLALLLNLPGQFGAKKGVNELLEEVMTRSMAIVPSAKRGALLLRDPARDTFLLKAYVSGGEPAVSQTLARRALSEKQGFIWRAGKPGDTSRSMREHQMATGMCAPLQWREHAFGVILVDSPYPADNFEESELELLMAIGQYVGMALAEEQYRAELSRNTKLVDRLLTNFSPKVRAVLVEQARLGKLRPGGVKSEVSVLFADICGFTKQAAQTDAQDLVDMLNQYFQPIVEVIFRHDGTVDKFVGDAVLAVFGSPEPDLQHHEKAVRAALAIQEAVRATSKSRAARGEPTCTMRLGLHSGEVFHGFIGGADRIEYTVIGDAVNRACRFCEAAGEGEIVISQQVFERVFNLVKADKRQIRTPEGEVTAFGLSGLRG